MKLVFCCWYCEEPNVCLGCVCLNLFVNHVDTAMLQERDLTETTEHIMSNKVKLEQLEEALDTARQHIQVAVQKGVVAPLPVVKVKVESFLLHFFFGSSRYRKPRVSRGY
eukprot:m.429922 g.429922  ORF g.429922 m.429922 type:complete len:110 (-) comp20240_c6_seq9:3225-3554(-)